ncbi:hypothetical protein MSAN_01543600 [Mycena sanguinolenta]|uniref:F-box domain-containing protein n=1 Tax=Mycena sanguinolenta TaxID=230812 RepID=A0A8H6Y3M3_9AGAR|nr:hypothetical protein MSAN_01543600 [Mycena sanguinolenta]
MPFEALGEDVLLKILCSCDIFTVLAVSAINKGLRHIALSKQLWLSLVLDTRFRDALDLPPPDCEKLECLSPEELIAVVKNAVTGPGSLWDSPHDASCSVTMTSFQIPLNEMEDSPDTRRLPGARYLLLHTTSATQHTFYLYDVWSARRVWYRLMQGYTVCEVDLAPGGAIARVFLVQKVDHPNTCTLQVEEVDLMTGASHKLFNFSLGSIVFGVAPCAIVGDFLLGTVLQPHRHYNDTELLLINWHASTFVSLSRDYLFQAQLIPGYILTTYLETSPRYAHVLALTALEAFSDRWQPLPDDGAGLAAQLETRLLSTTRINSLNITTQERLQYSGWPIDSELVSVTPDPLCSGAYNIFVSGYEYPPPRPTTLMERIRNRISSMVSFPRRGGRRPMEDHAVWCYQFTPVSAAGEGCTLRLVSARRVSDWRQAHCPRAIIPLSQGNSINVVYRERKRTSAVADAA